MLTGRCGGEVTDDESLPCWSGPVEPFGLSSLGVGHLLLDSSHQIFSDHPPVGVHSPFVGYIGSWAVIEIIETAADVNHSGHS